MHRFRRGGYRNRTNEALADSSFLIPPTVVGCRNITEPQVQGVLTKREAAPHT